MFATSLALLAHSFRGSERAVAFSAWGATTGAAVALGPILGGTITNDIGWRWIFLVNIPVGALALVVTLRRVQESRESNVSGPDWAGFVLLTGGLVGLVYGLIRASETAWTDTTVLASLATGATLLTGFVVAESRVAHPMFDLSLFRTPTFVGGSIAAFTMNASLFAMFLYLVIYLQDDLGYSPLGAGLRLLIITGALLVTAVISGRLSEHVPIRLLIGLGLALVGTGLFLMSRPGRRQLVDPPDPRLRHLRHRRRARQPATGRDRYRRRHPQPVGHGLRGELDIPAGRHRHQRGRARLRPVVVAAPQP